MLALMVLRIPCVFDKGFMCGCDGGCCWDAAKMYLECQQSQCNAHMTCKETWSPRFFSSYRNVSMIKEVSRYFFPSLSCCVFPLLCGSLVFLEFRFFYSSVSLLGCKSWVLDILSPVSCSERLLCCHMDVLTALQPEQ